MVSEKDKRERQELAKQISLKLVLNLNSLSVSAVAKILSSISKEIPRLSPEICSSIQSFLSDHTEELSKPSELASFSSMMHVFAQQKIESMPKQVKEEVQQLFHGHFHPPKALTTPSSEALSFLVSSMDSLRILSPALTTVTLETLQHNQSLVLSEEFPNSLILL